MCRIYLKLINAPSSFYEREGVLRLTGQFIEGNDGQEKYLTAWEQLLHLTQVSGDTASKALKWMHQQGIIGYHARKNGVGIWIFINRALSSIKKIEEQKNLRPAPAPYYPARTPEVGTPFKTNYVKIDILDKDNPHAPKTGAETKIYEVDEAREEAASHKTLPTQKPVTSEETETANPKKNADLDRLIARLQTELEKRLATATARATSDAHEHTRQWFEQKALPKAIRIGQKEAYNVLRTYGLLKRESRSESQVGKSFVASENTNVKQRTHAEIRDLAEACVAMFELQGKAIEQTISEMCASEKTKLSADDAEHIKKVALEITQGSSEPSYSSKQAQNQAVIL
jgi:DNA-binding transcriptional regulator YhcF (GntR family)